MSLIIRDINFSHNWNTRLRGGKETGKLDWRYHFGLPFAKAKVDLTMEGTSSSTLGPVGMKMEGDATLKAYPFPLVTGVTVGLTTLIPGSVIARPTSGTSSSANWLA